VKNAGEGKRASVVPSSITDGAFGGDLRADRARMGTRLVAVTVHIA
jgi:hypothetical protein